MLRAYLDYWKGYVDFKGRTSAGGYWWAFLAHFIVSVVVSLLGTLLAAGRAEASATVSLTFMCLCLLPSLAIMIRRLRDAGYGWANIFWSLVPLAGPIILIIRLCKGSNSTSYRAVTQPVSASGAPVYQTYPSPQAAPRPTQSAPPAPRPAPMAKPAPTAASGSIVDQYRAGLRYLDGCGAFDEAKFREFNSMLGNRFPEADVQKQLSNARMMSGGMEEIKAVLRSTVVEAIGTFEELERNGIDLAKYKL